MIRKLPRNKFKICLIASALTAVTLFSGCNKSEQPATAVAVPGGKSATTPQQPVKAVQKNVSSSVKLPQQPVGNQFDFSGKKDPFKPDIAAKLINRQPRDDVKTGEQPSLPIHSYDVSQFRLIGIITGSKENQAMVVDPTGKGYVLKPGMSIGKNEGRIISINANGVDVVEQFKDDGGRVRKENIKITLPRKQ